MIPDPSSPLAPKYWVNETGGDLKPAIEHYLAGEELTIRDLGLIRAYLRQWVDSPVWDANPASTDLSRKHLAKLRSKVFDARTKERLDDCVTMAVEMGMDPL